MRLDRVKRPGKSGIANWWLQRGVEARAKGKRKSGARPLHLSVNKVDGKLYRVEASEPLDPGEYSLSPNDSNKVFCFEVY